MEWLNLETLIHVLVGMYIGWWWAKPAWWSMLDKPVIAGVSWLWNKLKTLWWSVKG